MAKKNASNNPENINESLPVNSALVNMPLTKAAQFMGGSASTIFTQPMFFSPLHTPQSWQIASKRKEVYQWARFYYENEPKAAAGVDFYAGFPMNGFDLECKDKKILAYYEHMVEKLELNKWLRRISHEYFLLGDVFVFSEVSCPHCHGVGMLNDGRQCNHPDGTFKRILVLNPDFIEVNNSQLADHPTIALIPDDDLKKVIAHKKPKEVYDSIPQNIKDMISSGAPIPLSSRCVSHIRHKGSPYGVYGESLLRRLFMLIAYKTKLMTANWIMAERHILPIRIAKVGNDNRPASEFDIADVQSQLAAVANDPNLTIVTHHAFELIHEGATGKIHDIASQLEYVGKEMLDGLMLNQGLLNGELAGYSSVAIGAETMIRRLETWRQELAEWVEKYIFLPVAQMQGFVDVSKSELIGETVYLYPKIKWNDLRLRDNTNYLQSLMQLHDKGIISTQKLLSEFNIDYDQEVNRIREEQIISGKGGLVQGGAGGAPGGMDLGMGGGMPGGMDLGGGMPGGMDLGGGMPGGMDLGGGMPGGGAPAGGAPAGGAPAGGAPAGGAPAGGAPATASNIESLTKIAQFDQSFSVGNDFKVYKRGKQPKVKDDQKGTQEKLTPVYLTKPEQKLYNIITRLGLPYRVYAQYKQQVPGQQNPYLLDFAIPELGLDLEADGDFWHSDPESIQRDKERDYRLASMGWRIIRLREDALNNKADVVETIIRNNIQEIINYKRKKADTDLENGLFFKISSNSMQDDIVIIKNSLNYEEDSSQEN